MREAEVTVARPHRYCAEMMPAYSAMASQRGSVASRVQLKTPVALGLRHLHVGIASTIAHSITQPNTPETSTERTMPRGTLCAAPTVSSAVCAEASKPVMV